jgi:hypothetical protein
LTHHVEVARLLPDNGLNLLNWCLQDPERWNDLRETEPDAQQQQIAA